LNPGRGCAVGSSTSSPPLGLCSLHSFFSMPHSGQSVHFWKHRMASLI
jgi:hypothetical protein